MEDDPSSIKRSMIPENPNLAKHLRKSHPKAKKRVKRNIRKQPKLAIPEWADTGEIKRGMSCKVVSETASDPELLSFVNIAHSPRVANRFHIPISNLAANVAGIPRGQFSPPWDRHCMKLARIRLVAPRASTEHRRHASYHHAVGPPSLGSPGTRSPLASPGRRLDRSWSHRLASPRILLARVCAQRT